VSPAQNESFQAGRAWRALTILLLAAFAVAVWIHRIEIDAPDSHRTPVQAHTYRYSLPVAQFIHHEVRSGRLPLWNPYQFAGQPFFALPGSGALYPINLVVMGLFEAPSALAVHAVLHFFLAGLFSWLLGARLGLHPLARSSAALAYMLSAPMLLGVYLPVHLSTQAWLPGIVWALHGLLSETRLKWALALALLTALAFYGGQPQLFLYIAEFGAVFALAGFFWLTPREMRLRAAGLLALAGVLASGWVMPSLLPQLEFARQAANDLEGLSLHQASHPFVRGAALLAGISRGLVDASTGNPSGPVLGRVALPAFFLPLVLCGLLAHRARFYWLLFLAAGAAVGLLALGPQTPVFAVYSALPLGALFRGTIQFAFLYAFCGAMLLGIGVQGITDFIYQERDSRSWALAAGMGLMLFIAGDSYLRTRLVSAHPASHGEISGAPAELIEFMRGLPGRERIYFQTHNLYSPDFLLKAGSIHGFFVAGDHEPSLPRAYRDYFGYSGADPWYGDSTILPGQKPRTHSIDPRLLDLMSVRFYGVHEPGSGPARAQLERILGPVYTQLGKVAVYQRPGALPRAYTVDRVQPARDWASAIETVRLGRFAPRMMAIVSGENLDLPPSLLPGHRAPRGARTPGTVRANRIEAATPQEVILAATCRDPCLSVLTDLDYPGWEARVDGEPAAILRVNGLFRGVVLSPGEHRIVYRFVPRTLTLGLWAALAASVLAAASWVFERRRRAA